MNYYSERIIRESSALCLLSLRACRFGVGVLISSFDRELLGFEELKPESARKQLFSDFEFTLAARREYVSNYGAMDTEVVQPNSSREISAICDNVTSSLYVINSRVKNLRSVVDNLGTPKDSHQLREQIQTWQQEVNHKIKTSQDDITKLNSLARSANKQQKLQISKITSHCKDAVEGFCKIQQEVVQKLRSNLIYPGDPSGGFNDDSSAFIDKEQLQVQKNLEFENQMLLERQQSVKQIESDIVKLNSIMKELGALVHEQGGTVDTIENRIESAYEDVRAAHQELSSAARYQAKSRKRKIYLLLILAVILAILIGVIVWSAKS